MKLIKLLIGLLFLFLLCGCRTRTVYVPVESVKTEYQDRIVRDSIYQRDSIFFAIKGDTVFIEHYSTLYKDRFLRDSIFIQDTIRIPYPVDKIVEVNHLKWYQKTLMWLGVGILAIFIFWIVNKFYKR